MTIVLQHRFWGLAAGDDGFSVTLSFGGRSERLAVPYEAVTAFMDPAVDFGLRFGPQPDGDAAADEDRERPQADAGTVVTLDSFRKT